MTDYLGGCNRGTIPNVSGLHLPDFAQKRFAGPWGTHLVGSVKRVASLASLSARVASCLTRRRFFKTWFSNFPRVINCELFLLFPGLSRGRQAIWAPAPCQDGLSVPSLMGPFSHRAGADQRIPVSMAASTSRKGHRLARNVFW